MEYEHIDFMSRAEIEWFENSNEIIAISIASPGMTPAALEDKFLDVLYLEFDNSGQLSPDPTRFNEKDAQKILIFTDKYKGCAKTILINCMVGESRSASVAMYLSNKYSLPLVRETNRYNPWIVRQLERQNENLIGNKNKFNI